MKKIIGIGALLAAVILLYLLIRPGKDILSDPRLERFARLQAELSIEAERLANDSSLLQPVRDSLLRHFGVTPEWVEQVKVDIDKRPEKWIEVYELMIRHTEYIKDSLLHKRLIPGDSAKTGIPPADR